MPQTLRRASRGARPPYVRNPPWTTKAVVTAWDLIQDSVKPAWLPLIDEVATVGTKGARLSGRVQEYGCGAYGCVFPTHDPEVVLKVTTDETEASFASKIYPTLVRPVTTAYYTAVALNQYYEEKRIYLLWREAANKVGEIGKVLGPRAVELIAGQKEAANHALVSVIAYREHKRIRFAAGPNLEEQRVTAMDELTLWYMQCEYVARQSEEPALRELFTGILWCYSQQRVFFGDVHAGNVGLVHREDGGHWVITDPGYAMVIDPDIDGVGQPA